MMPRLIEAYMTYIAAIKAGFVVIPSSEMLRKKDIEYRIGHGEVKAIVSYEPYIGQFDDIEAMDSLQKFVLSEQSVDGWINLKTALEKESDMLEMAKTDKEDMVFFILHVRNDRKSKKVLFIRMRGHTLIYVRALQIGSELKRMMLCGRRLVQAGKSGFGARFLATLGSGATGFVYHGKFEPKTYLNLLDDNKVNVLCCTPTEYRLMAKVENLSEYNLGALHSAVSAGEPLNREVIETFQKHFHITVRDGYGQTENTLLVGVMKGMDIRPGSMGKPTPGNHVDIVNEEGVPVKVGEVGDIAVHIETPALFKQYYKDDERTAMQFRGDYYITGDKAKKDEDGYFWFEGRGDDIIISSGYTIGPFEVEDALVKHPYVRECAVVASPDEIRGSVVKAFIVLRENIEKERRNINSNTPTTRQRTYCTI